MVWYEGRDMHRCRGVRLSVCLPLGERTVLLER